MHPDELQTLLRGVQDPAYAAVKHREALNGGGSFARMAREAQEISRFLPDRHFLDAQECAREAAERAQSLAGCLGAQEDAWLESARDAHRSLASDPLLGDAQQQARAIASATDHVDVIASAQAALDAMLTPDRITESVTRPYGAAQPGNEAYMAGIDADPSFGHVGGLGRHALDEAQRALEPYCGLGAHAAQLDAEHIACRQFASEQVLAEAHEHARALASIQEHAASAQATLDSLIAPERVVEQMKELYGAALPGYEAYLACLGVNPPVGIGGMLDHHALSAIERDFEVLKQAATALEPLQRLAMSLEDSFGTALTRDAIENLLRPTYGTDVAAPWRENYREVTTLVRQTWDFDVEDEDAQDASPDENTFDGHASVDPEARTEGGVGGDAAVWGVAARYGIAGYEFQQRLIKLAVRIDPLVSVGDPDWKHMLLVVGHGHPAHAQALMRLAYPFLQQLDWATAKRGARANGTTERLAFEDVDNFEQLSRAILTLLREIESSLDH